MLHHTPHNTIHNTAHITYHKTHNISCTDITPLPPPLPRPITSHPTRTQPARLRQTVGHCCPSIHIDWTNMSLLATPFTVAGYCRPMVAAFCDKQGTVARREERPVRAAAVDRVTLLSLQDKAGPAAHKVGPPTEFRRPQRGDLVAFVAR